MPSGLRSLLAVDGELVVMGMLSYIGVRDEAKFPAATAFSDEDPAALAQYGK